MIRTDPTPGFLALRNDKLLQRSNLKLEIGRIKNPNKNPVADKGIRELEDELMRLNSSGGPVSRTSLSQAIAVLNSRIRFSGVPAQELWTQKDQFKDKQIPVSDREVITKQNRNRNVNHEPSKKSKNPSGRIAPLCNSHVVYLVYLHADRDKTRARDRYLVVGIEGEWCTVWKFVGSQIRSQLYSVHISDYYTVQHKAEVLSSHCRHRLYPESDSDDMECAINDSDHQPSPLVHFSSYCTRLNH